jgi:hypothetical protein
MSSEIQRARFVVFLLSFWAFSVPEHHQLFAFIVNPTVIGTRSVVGVPTISGIDEKGALIPHRESFLAVQQDYGDNPPITEFSSKTPQSLPDEGLRRELLSRTGRPYRRPLQQRRSITRSGSWNRKPRFYWKDVHNIEHELRQQWESALLMRQSGDDDKDKNDRRYDDLTGILLKLLPTDRPPPIPNEALLNHWKRNDLRAAIRQFGRPYLAELLLLEQYGMDDNSRDGPAVDPALIDSIIVPGKWKEAVQWPIVQHVVQADDRLFMDLAPPSSQRVKLMKESYNMTEREIEEWMQDGRWQYRNNTSQADSGRREKGYWSEQTVIEVL